MTFPSPRLPFAAFLALGAILLAACSESSTTPGPIPPPHETVADPARSADAAVASPEPIAAPTATVMTAADAGAPRGLACRSGESYVACECGCCGLDPITRCLDTAHGETLAKVRARDQERKSSSQCSFAGCSRGVKYVCCSGS